MTSFGCWPNVAVVGFVTLLRTERDCRSFFSHMTCSWRCQLVLVRVREKASRIRAQEDLLATGPGP
jgi:hypothetical protein